MAIRMKVDRAALLDGIDAALAVTEEDITAVKQEQEAWDWREGARQAVESLTKALDDRKTSEEAFDSLWYKVKRDKPNFESRLRHAESRKKNLLDFRDLVGMSKEDGFSVSTNDEFVGSILRAIRRKK